MSTKIKLEFPYSELWKFGYLNTNSENRKTLTLYNSQNDRSSCQYARYLISVKLGRFLNEDEEVDHIDNDKTNDDLSNLQVLSRQENREKQIKLKGRTMIEFECPICEVVTSKERRFTPIINPSKRVLTCSRKCGRKASKIKDIVDPIRIIREWVNFKQ